MLVLFALEILSLLVVVGFVALLVVALRPLGRSTRRRLSADHAAWAPPAVPGESYSPTSDNLGTPPGGSGIPPRHTVCRPSVEIGPHVFTFRDEEEKVRAVELATAALKEMVIKWRGSDEPAAPCGNV